MKLLNEKQLKKNIKSSIVRHFYKALSIKAEAIKQKVSNYNLDLWKMTDTYESLIRGDLNHEFGFHEGTAKNKVDSVLFEISRRVQVIPKFSIKADPFILKIIVIQNGRVGNVLDSKNAKIPINPTKNRDHIPWLRWLLFFGNSYLIKDYAYLDIKAPDSRSGRGIMEYEEGDAWKIPSEYAGTSNSNWLSRTFEENRRVVESAYKTIIMEVLNSSEFDNIKPESGMIVTRSGNTKFVRFE